MGIFTGMTELELVEKYIQELYRPHSTVYADEEILSEAFDAMVKEVIESGSDINLKDTDMLTQWFNDWTDSECKEGNLHDVQYNNYEYVGEYS